VKAVTDCTAGENGSFNCICQVMPIYTYTTLVISISGVSPLMLADHYKHGWLLYALNSISTQMQQCWCRQSHYCGIELPTNYHNLLQETCHVYIAVHHYWTRHWLNWSRWYEIIESVWYSFYGSF